MSHAEATGQTWPGKVRPVAMPVYVRRLNRF